MWILQHSLTAFLTMIYIFHYLGYAKPDIDWEQRQREEECVKDNCGSLKKSFEEQMKGNWRCCDQDEYEDGPVMVNPCKHKCEGFGECKNTLECQCKVCLNGNIAFCSEPNATMIRADQCQELVCTGKVKYHGVYGCSWENQAGALKILEGLPE